ncbi:MAG: hypothetical protein KatS3mg115_1447 [Candidatus Poribacteria bacterium]|nr:MAG: hypothetical protein KatS3mg115_1447 [Candidatus Poribacteria bacterium]
MPDRVKVVGYDDIDFASYVAPTLTTVQIPKEEMGKTAVELLCRRLERQEEPAPPERIVLPVRLCPRETTQCS